MSVYVRARVYVCGFKLWLHNDKLNACVFFPMKTRGIEIAAKLMDWLGFPDIQDMFFSLWCWHNKYVCIKCKWCILFYSHVYKLIPLKENNDIAQQILSGNVFSDSEHIYTNQV